MCRLDNDAGRTRAASTVREYRRRIDSYVTRRIGHYKLRSLTTVQIEQVLDQMAKDGLSKSSIRGCRNAVSAMLGDAVQAHLLRANVAAQARLPVVAEPSRKPQATAHQVLSLLTLAADSELAELLLLITYTGCRIGEALAVQWSDIDLEAGEWFVCRTTTLDEDGRVIIGERTKTGDPRTAYLQPAVIKALYSQRAKVAAMRLRAGNHWHDHDLVFPSSVGTPQDSRNVRKRLRTLAGLAGYPSSFHGLRHLFATIAASKVNLTALAKVLGHRRTATTADLYAHLYDRDAMRASAAITEALESGAER